jgi:hypothetical protein
MGIGLRDDSFAYISSAEGLATGAGYGRISGDGAFKPLTSFPPLYSVSLAATHLIGLEFQAGARLINGLGFAATIFLSGLLLRQSTSSSISALFAAGFILASGTMYSVHSWALSEGLFLNLSLTSIILTAFCQRHPERNAFLILAAISTSLAVMTRFIGLALIPPALAAFYLNPAKSKSRRLTDIGVFTGISITPLLLFYTRNYLLTGNFANAPSPAWHPPDYEMLLEGAGNVIKWFWPYRLEPPESAFAMLVSGAILIMLVTEFGRRVVHLTKLRNKDPQVTGRWTVFLLISYSLSYLAFLLFSMTFIHKIIRLNPRILAPLFINFALLFAILLKRLWDRSRYPLRSFIILAGAISLVIQIQIGVSALSSLRNEGQGFNSHLWRASPTIEFVKSLPDAPIYTNDIPALYFLAGRLASIVPVETLGTTGAPREDFKDQLILMRNRLNNQGAILVFIGPALDARLDPAYFAEITEGLILIEQFGDGMVYEHASNP